MGKMICEVGGCLYYGDSTGKKLLGSGLYKMGFMNLGEGFIPVFKPLEASNDVVLDIDDIALNMSNEIKDFFDRKDRFKKLGFSHKRGYLLHGGPGVGKSATLRLLERDFISRFDGLVLFWDNGSALGEFMKVIRENEPDRPVMVVCEDIEGQLRDFEESILEFLDGHVGLNNFVLVATTNVLEQIPSRIKDRPSRIDRVIEVKNPNLKVRTAYLLSLGIETGVAESLAARTDGLSIAKLKEIIVATVCLDQDLDTVLERMNVADMSPLNVKKHMGIFGTGHNAAPIVHEDGDW